MQPRFLVLCVCVCVGGVTVLTVVVSAAGEQNEFIIEARVWFTCAFLKEISETATLD